MKFIIEKLAKKTEKDTQMVKKPHLTYQQPTDKMALLSKKSIDVLFRIIVVKPALLPACLANSEIAEKFTATPESREKLIQLASASQENCQAVISANLLSVYPKESQQLENISASYSDCCSMRYT